MSSVKDKDGVVHMALAPGQLPFLIAHCDAIGANHTGQTWKPAELVDEKVSCVHCIADVKKAVGLEEGLGRVLVDNSVRELQELEDKRFADAVDAEIARRSQR